MAQVTVNMPGTPKGARMVVPGLGVFENGETKEIDEILLSTYNANNPSRPLAEDGHLYIPITADPNYVKPAPRGDQYVREETSKGRVLVDVPNEKPTGPLDGSALPVEESPAPTPARTRRSSTDTSGTADNNEEV